jgi:hypothetical protein
MVRTFLNNKSLRSGHLHYREAAGVQNKTPLGYIRVTSALQLGDISEGTEMEQKAQGTRSSGNWISRILHKFLQFPR